MSLPKEAIQEVEDYLGLSVTSLEGLTRMWYRGFMIRHAEQRKQIHPPNHKFDFYYLDNGWYVVHDTHPKHIIATAPTFKQLLIKMELLKWPIK